MTTPQVTRVANPYSIRKAKNITKQRTTNITTFSNITANYVDILLRHDAVLQTQPWYELCQSWFEWNILEDANLHMVSVTVELPPTIAKTNKAVADFILEKVIAVKRFMTISVNTRGSDPWIHLTRPIIMRNTPKKGVEHNANDMESKGKLKTSTSDDNRKRIQLTGILMLILHHKWINPIKPSTV